RYPHAEYPYQELRDANAARDRTQREYGLADTGVLADNRFFDVHVRYAKAAPGDICVEIEAVNHGPSPAPLDLLPPLWLRNTWAWG
ncbi:glucosidase, partial [Tsukamurella paurometabola]|nr:glucosidase [Tsukamurella paurometabola]